MILFITTAVKTSNPTYFVDLDGLIGQIAIKASLE
jgi:hypothetical protein